jgi:nitric oxide reductase NorD protein
MTSSDWGQRLQRGRWLLRVAGEIARRDRRLAAGWAQEMRVLRREFQWELAIKAGTIVATVAEQSVSSAQDLLEHLAVQLAKVPTGREHEFLDALAGLVSAKPESAVHALHGLPEAMMHLNPTAFLSWCRSLAEGDSTLEATAAELKGESEAGRAKLLAAQPGIPLLDVRAALSHYIQAHAGRNLPIEVLDGPRLGPVAFSCDNHRVFLPERIDFFGDERDALSYRVGAAMAAGFVEAGSFDLDLAVLPGFEPVAHGTELSAIESLCSGFILPGAVRQLFERLERVRVCAVLSKRYPGLGRDISLWRQGVAQGISEAVPQASAVDQVLSQMEVHWITGTCQEPLALDWMAEANRRLNSTASVEVSASLLLRMAPQLMELLPPKAVLKSTAGPEDMDLSRRRNGEKALDQRLRDIQGELQQADIQSRLESIRAVLENRQPVNDTDYGEMAAYLERNPPPDGGLVDQVEAVKGANGPSKGGVNSTLTAQGGFLYDEWDEEIGDYRPDWVRVVDHEISVGNFSFVEETRAEQGQHIEALRRRFEALRPAAFRQIKGQLHGDALDLDRLIAARIDYRAGRTPDDRVYRQTRRAARSVSVAFLVDLSSSTNEPARFGGKRIIDVEKQALLVTAEALDALGDSFAIFGFSGFSREEVAFYTAKDFQTPYSDAVRAKIGGLNFKMENRDGTAIRHAGAKLMAQEAKTRVLFLLSDGKPLDCGCPQYKDDYAQADTRMALTELRKMGIQALCVTVDPHGGDYLAELYGKGNYTVVDDVERLPLQLPQFYQRLTT